MLAIAFLVGYLVAQRRARSRGIDQTAVLDLAFYILVSAIVGSRLFYVVTHWDQYAARPLAAFSIWEGGLSMMGGVLLALLVSWLYLKKREISFKAMADVVAPSLALGLAFTRVGCFLYGCCYGLPTDLPWGVQFPPGSGAGSHFHELIHPAQLYESGYGLLVFAMLLLVDRLRLPDGVLGALLLVLYASERFTLDFFRYYEPNQYVLLRPVALTNNQVINLFLFLFGLMMMIWLLRRGKVPARAR